MANMIARLGVVLGLDSAEFSKGLETAGRKLEQFGQAAEKMGRSAALAMGAATAAALQYADELADVAQANDVAIGTVLKLSNALANSGGKADNAGKMLSAFSKFIDEAAEGSLKAQTTAAKLGITLKDIGTLSQEELLNKFVKNLAKVEDPITRSAKQMEIFSKAAKGVDMVGFAEQMAEVNKITEQQEEAVKNAAETYDILAQSSRDAMLVIATSVGPTLKTMAEYIKELNSDGNLFGEIFKTAFQTVAVVAANVFYVVKAVFDEIKAMFNYVDNLINKNWATAEAENDAYIKKTIEARAKLDLFEMNILDPKTYETGGKEKPKGGRATKEAKNPEDDKRERERLAALRRYYSELQRLDKILLDVAGKENSAFVDSLKRIENEEQALKIKNGIFQLEQQTKNLRSEDIQLNKDLYLLDQQRLENIREINRNNDLEIGAKDYLIAQQNALTEATIEYTKAQYNAGLAQRKGSYEQGFGNAMQKFLRDLPTELELGAKAFETVMGNMESAIDRFVKTGKLGFKDLAKSIIQDMIAMQMKAAASNFLSSMFGSMFGMRANPYQPAAMTGVPGYADGGSPAVGQPSIVGERGPELFVPRTAGSIIPNHALSNMGGTTMVTNNYINAIDTKSFEDRLLASPNAVWAANQYGGKSLAVNRGRA
jgi:lambda family phage tail tape measure protein